MLNFSVQIGLKHYFVLFQPNRKGLIYLEVPIDASDHISVPPLEGFVMNRVLGDYFENLLYKIFVSVDEKTSVGEVHTRQSYTTIPTFNCDNSNKLLL